MINEKKIKIYIIQPLIPHYRIPFFDGLARLYDLYIRYGRDDPSFKSIHTNYTKKVKGVFLGKIEFFFVFLDIWRVKPDVIVTYGEVKQLTNLFLIPYKYILDFKLLIWSHGFKNNKLSLTDRIRLAEMKLADGVIFYTHNCFTNAKKFKLKNTCYLNNTIQTISPKKSPQDKKTIANSLPYNIKTTLNGVFISRFTEVKKPRLLLDIMTQIHSKNKNIGFIIIGDGVIKPDFSSYDFIYDFGKVYDNKKKSALLSLADFAIMPSGIGLSVIECFSYRLPMFTLSNKMEDIEHGVEYSYLKHNINSYIAKNVRELTNTIASIDKTELSFFGNNTDRLVHENLTIDNMVKNFLTFIETLQAH